MDGHETLKIGHQFHIKISAANLLRLFLTYYTYIKCRTRRYIVFDIQLLICVNYVQIMTNNLVDYSRLLEILILHIAFPFSISFTFLMRKLL